MKKILATSSVIALLLVGCKAPTDTSSEDILKIGYVGPLTGEAVAYGMDTLNGVKMKIQEVNDQGGINGKKLLLIAEDGRCNGADAASATQKLVNVDKVVAIIGGACSGETLAGAPIAEAAQIVWMSPTSSSPDVTDAGDFIFRDYPSDALKTKAMAQYFASVDIANVAVITENTDFAVGFRDALAEDLPEGALVFNEVVEPGTKDFRTLLTRLSDTDYDVFVTNAQSVPVMAAMLEQLREGGSTVPAITHDVGDSIALIEAATDAAEDLYIINVPNAGEDGAFEANFTESFGAPQQGMAFVAHAYDAAGVVLQAIDNVGTDGPAVRDYLYTLNRYTGEIGRFSFDANGDVEGINYVLKQVQDGQIVTLRPIVLQ